MRKIYVPAIALAIGLTVAGCQGEAAQYGEETEMGMTSAEQTQMIDDFRTEARARLDSIDQNIQMLGERADSAAMEMQSQLQQEVEEFQTRSEQVERQLRALTYESDAAWEQAKSLVNQTIDLLAQDVEAALDPMEEPTT